MTVYSSAADLPLGGWRNRSAKAAARLDAKNSPLAQAIARVRAAHQDVRLAEDEAHRKHAEQYRPIANPLPPLIHPQVAEAVASFLAEKGIRDPLQPLTETVPLSAMVALACAEARTRLAEAERDAARAEAAEARFNDLLAAGPDGLADALQAVAGKPPEPIEDAPAEPEPIGTVAPRRGRPPKMADGLSVPVVPD